jgi:hypothetical protein
MSKHPQLRALAYRLIHEAGSYGRTEWEVSTASGFQRWSIQPRVSDLARAKSIVDSGRTRMNPSGFQAIVWVAPQFAPDHKGDAHVG